MVRAAQETAGLLVRELLGSGRRERTLCQSDARKFVTRRAGTRCVPFGSRFSASIVNHTDMCERVRTAALMESCNAS
jgi:hypothetical protein